MKNGRTVLAILPMGNGMAQGALSGIRAEAAVRHWHILTAETERASDGSLRIERSSGRPRQRRGVEPERRATPHSPWAERRRA